MLRINALDAKGGKVRLGPFVTEDEAEPCLVWVAPQPNALVRFFKAQDANGTLVTSKTERGLGTAAHRIGYAMDPTLYVP